MKIAVAQLRLHLKYADFNLVADRATGPSPFVVHCDCNWSLVFILKETIPDPHADTPRDECRSNTFHRVQNYPSERNLKIQHCYG